MYIWKYDFAVLDDFEIMMPMNSQVLCVQMQLGNPCMWVLTSGDTSNTEERHFVIFGTGHPIQEEGLFYIGTFQQSREWGNSLVWHLFERIENGR